MNPKNDNEQYMKWLETRWDHYTNITREERRTEEILEALKEIAELARHRIEAPHFPPWESPW